MMNCARDRSGILSNDVDSVKESAKSKLAYSSQIKRPHLQLSTFYTNQSLPPQFVEKETNKENTAISHKCGNWGNSRDDNATDDTSLLFKAKYQLNHPRGFRLLQNESVIERHLHNYFRLPPAPCRALQAEREYIRYAMRVIDAREVAARENRRTCHYHHHSKENHVVNYNEQFNTSEQAAPIRVTEEGQQYNKHESNNNNNGLHALNKALLMSSTKAFAPEDVIEANLQDLELESAIADDLMEFSNLRSLDVSENKLTLCDVSSLPALQTLNMTCNEITSLEELHSMMSHELIQSNGIKESSKEKFKEEQEEYEYLEQELEQPISSSRSLHGLKKIHLSSQHMECMPFAQLTSLNMSYNHVPAHHVILFALLPSLEYLDLSGNELRVLPSNLSQFTHLKQIILQYNSFTTEMQFSTSGNNMNLRRNKEVEEEQETVAMTSNNNSSKVVTCTSNIFTSLSTAPALIIVDVSHNKLSAIPPFHVAEKNCNCEHTNISSSGTNNKSNKFFTSTRYYFPKWVHIDLSYNCFSVPTSILALASLHQTLRVIKVHHNPLCDSSTKTNMTRTLFDNVIVNWYYSPHFHNSTGTNSSFAQMESKEECTRDNDKNEDEEDEDSLRWHGDEWDQLLPTHELDKEKSMMRHSQNMASISAAAAAAAAACYSQRASSATSSHNTDTATKHADKENDSQCYNNLYEKSDCRKSKIGKQVCLNEWGEDVNEEYQRLSPYKEESEEEQEQEELEENNKTCETALHDHSSSFINSAAAQSTNTVPNNIYTMYKTADAYWHAFQIRLVFDDHYYCTPPLLRELYSTHPLPEYSHLESTAPTNNDCFDETSHAMRRLVTIPSYNEFMDIYRLVRCVPPTKRKHNSRWRRRTVPGTKMLESYKTQPDLSSWQNLREYTEIECQESPWESAEPKGQSSVICTRQTISAAVEANNKVQKDDNGFFITGVDQTVTFASQHATPHNSLINADRHKEPLTTTEHTLPLIRKSVISPSTMNVQHAMRELRMLLHKPLPPLPHTHKTRV